MKTRLTTLLIALAVGCAALGIGFLASGHLQASAATEIGPKPYPRPISVAEPEPGVRCYIVTDGAPATAAMACLERR